MRTSVIAIGSMLVALVTACSGEPTTDGSPPSNVVRGSVEAPAVVDAPASADAMSDVESLGLGSRFRRARDREAPACRRFLAHAGHARAELGVAQRRSPAASRTLATHLSRLSADFGRFDGLLLGELKHSLATYESGGGLTPAGLALVALDLRALLRSAGVALRDLDELDDTLDALSSASGTDTDEAAPASRAALGKVVVRIAFLLSTLQTCAPHGT